MAPLAEPAGVFVPLPTPYASVATESRKGIPPAHRASVYLYLCCESVITPTFVEASYGAAMAQVFHSGVPIALTHHTTYFGGCVELAPFDLTPPQVESFHRLCILFKNLSGINYCPYLVHLIPLLLTQASEAATFVAVSNLLKAHQAPGPPSTYRKLPASAMADMTLVRFFKGILKWRYSKIATALHNCQADSDEIFTTLFHQFFVGFFPMPVVHRVVDSYLADGPKILCRVLLAVFKFTRHEMVHCTATGEAWWAVLHALVNGPSFDFDAMFAAAYRRWYGYLFKKANIEAMHKLLEKQTSVHVETANHAHHNDGHYHMPLLIAPRSRSGRLLDPCRDTVVPTWLPPALQMKHLSLVYTAEVDGRGLERLYTHCEAAESPEMLLLVEELATSSIIGVFVSQPLQIQPTFFGDHRCFPFVLAPTPHVFKQATSPTHHDTTTPPAATVLKYMLCLPTMMSFGVCASSSAAALELDEDLMRGKSDESDLFQSPPLVGTTTAEFDVGGVEVYAFSLD
ncbi:hypothetical protein H310_12148 [Aphanomyces invadans]|uniref:Oxidation resistance protein 1 n=1 Tax=Aphanomyces invadans TaxID=157072 RepID=A0A024TJB1_9STRA|nr:hypothetical protein H310_12148 [Aphanomyces invadans]ETV94148.1 hypothetical protein H310_12148 [Aphanomyces invadans]|eukprot:XP_008877351.1 hypothetical protein H310_12148 [Aphanomyces invadans]